MGGRKAPWHGACLCILTEGNGSCQAPREADYGRALHVINGAVGPTPPLPGPATKPPVRVIEPGVTFLFPRFGIATNRLWVDNGNDRVTAAGRKWLFTIDRGIIADGSQPSACSIDRGRCGLRIARARYDAIQRSRCRCLTATTPAPVAAVRPARPTRRRAPGGSFI